MDQTCSSKSYRCLIRWGYGDLGNLEAQSAPWPFIVFLKLFLSSVCSVLGHIVLLGGGELPLGSVVVMRGCIWYTTVFGWVVCFKWHSHECQHLRFPSRTSHCDEMINVIHVTCQ